MKTQISSHHTAADGGKDGKDATGDEKSSSHHTTNRKGEEGKYSVSELRANAEILLVADNPHA